MNKSMLARPTPKGVGLRKQHVQKTRREMVRAYPARYGQIRPSKQGSDFLGGGRMLKRVWVTNIGSEVRPIYSISFRSKEKIGHSELVLPPTEAIEGKRLDIDEAKALGLTEIHTNLCAFSWEDLWAIKDALDTILFEGA